MELSKGGRTKINSETYTNYILFGYQGGGHFNRFIVIRANFEQQYFQRQ